MPNGSDEAWPSLPAIETVTVKDGSAFLPVLRMPSAIYEVWPRCCSVGKLASVTRTS
jgi:hypothetical protein